ncbi:hypothetical protein [Embleya scabrispora]|uniref:divisome protein SepX/GlpR n=1 Tax=Embleya scabrispora TaxID=159449 RepID=UPI00037C0870|nr:hypothetical protein [Embleya scabrispora]MYS79398.1 hypothetical protein [Streptomyces sp. SID5474]
MNGSGLIYAAIVGAWAAYLVPMWLRRQDELNEARPTERFTTAIRILSRRGAFERRSARVLAEARAAADEGTDAPERRGPAEPPRTRQHPAKAAAPQPTQQPAVPPGAVPSAKAAKPGAAKRPAGPARRDEGRAALLTRRRRVIATLFAAFTAGAIVAGVAGLAWVWLPAVPGVLLSAYIVHLRVQERRRYEAGLRRLGRPAGGKSGAPVDAASAAESRPRAKARETHDATPPEPRAATPPTGGDARQGRTPRSRPTGSSGPNGASGVSASPRGRRDREAEEPALAEWIAELATDGGPHDRDSWDPVPVPLPTYVTAPVVPRGDVEHEPERPQIHAVPDAGPTEAPRPSTPLFDQYAEDTRTGYGASVDSLPLYEHEWRRAVNE